VTAGVYILIRLRTFFSISLIDYSYIVFGAVFFISSITILKARLAALLEKDIKKIIALSTLRQLGVIIIAISFEQY
jgi:NADH-ubiquinone oxidoreductase chain 5